MTKLILTFSFLSLTFSCCNAAASRQKRLIAFGTKWCGEGNEASDDNDLGKFSEIDACCRTHDKCPIFIPIGQTKYGIHNDGTLTRVSCDCDNAFFSCLKGTAHNRVIAEGIGKLYFTIIQNQCLYEDYPVTCSG